MAYVKASRNLRRMMVGTLAFIAPLTFACSGSYLYKARTTTINLPLLASLAEHYQVRTITGFEDARDILAVMDYTAGHILRDRNLQLQLFGKNPYYNSNITPVSPGEIGKALIVAYRAPLHFDLPQVDMTILWEDFGPALAYPTVNQSIYYPPNGFFVYLLTEKQE